MIYLFRCGQHGVCEVDRPAGRPGVPECGTCGRAMTRVYTAPGVATVPGGHDDEYRR